MIYSYKNTTCILQVCLATENSSEKQTGGGTGDRIDSTIVRSRDVSEEKLLHFGDVHGLLDGGVPTADLKEAALQRDLACHHGEENSHLVVPEAKRPHRLQRIGERDAVRKQCKPKPETGQTLPCRQLLHRCWLCFEVPGPHRDLGLPQLQCQAFTHLQQNIKIPLKTMFSLKNGKLKAWSCPIFPTCLSSTVAPRLISSATLTGANTGCNFST